MSFLVPISDGRGTSLDWQGRRVGQQSYYVDIRDSKGAQEYVAQNAGMATNSPFPGFPSVICDVVQDRPAPDGIGTIVTGIYSSDRRFGSWTKIDKDRNGYYQFNDDSRLVKVKTPVQVVGYISVQNPAGSKTDIACWVIESHDIEEARRTITVEVTVNDWNLSKGTAVRNQTGKLHTIGGIKYRFMGGRTHQVRQSAAGVQATWRVTYEHLDDPGSPPVTATPKYQVGEVSGRSPHAAYVVQPSSDPTMTPHVITEYQPYASEPSGHLSLPGWPPL